MPARAGYGRVCGEAAFHPVCRRDDIGVAANPNHHHNMGVQEIPATFRPRDGDVGPLRYGWKLNFLCEFLLLVPAVYMVLVMVAAL